VSDPHAEVTWPIQPHTEAKHAILIAYLRAWFPILSLGGFARVIYVDGFAGPGRYTAGQDGSPILAIKALALQKAKLNSSFEFHFVERDARVAAALNANIAAHRSAGQIPPSATIQIHSGQTFEEAYDRTIGPRLRANPGAPAFAMIDPFGWTGIPMRIVSELLRRPSTKVLINFMFEEINRFLSHPDQPANFDTLFGSSNWRGAVQLSGAERRKHLHDLYQAQLGSIGEARFVRSFEMRNDRRLVDYFLFFATSSPKGLSKMKEAMWRVGPGGSFSFSDATDLSQPMLFEPEPNRQLLRRLIFQKFAGTRTRVSEIERFVVEQTPFLSTHYKRVLEAMEKDRLITPVNAPTGRRVGTFPDGALTLAFSDGNPTN
jgi:three-Cys-motif partner protein